MEIKIVKFTHFFKVSEPDPILQEKLTDFVKHYLVEPKLEYIDGQYRKVPGRVFATRTKDKREYRFHINCLELFTSFFTQRGHQVVVEKDESEEVYPGDDAEFIKPSGFQLRDYQEEAVTFLLEPKCSRIIELAPGKGKGLDLNTLVRLRNGWVPIKELKIGDKVLTPSGDVANVIGIFDNKNMDCYRITFDDGRNCVCDTEHLWEIFSSQGHHGDASYETIEMRELVKRYEKELNKPTKYKSKYIDLKIPLTFPLGSGDRNLSLPVDPYFLGVFLGDGHFQRRGAITISKPDIWIKEELDRLLSGVNCVTSRPSNSKDRCLAYRIVSTLDTGFNHIRSGLSILGLRSKRSWEKFIPEAYLNASFDQRLALMQGLMDTDGSVNSSDSAGIEFTTTSEKMAEQFVELARSLGAIAKTQVRRTRFTYRGEKRLGRVSYRIRLRPQIPSLFFRTPIKKNRTNDAGQYLIKGLKLRIKNIEYVGKRDTRCIKVDHPDEMYVIQDYICTHNTQTSLWAISEYRKKACIFVLGRYTERWWGDLGSWVDSGSILEIRGSLELEDVLRNSESPTVRNTKMFVMTITTFSDYCAKWENGTFEDRQSMVPPEMVWEVLGVGIRVTDETHQHFHQNFLTDLYTHIPKAVYLSATLNPGDAFLKRMYETFLPLKDRFGAGLQEKYTRVNALFYRFKEPRKIRCQNRKRMYNHTEFEKWLMKNPKLLLNYFEMIDEIVKDDYLSVKKEGQKMLIFFATKLMCEKYAKHLKTKWPKIDSRKYVSEDKYENLLQADIACSTLGSSGTAVDIPNLLRCLMTTALKSEQANLQALGRLRKLEDETVFSYLVCTDIPKHLEYHDKKKRLFRDWVKSLNIYHTEKSI